MTVQMLTMQQAADALGCSRMHVYRLVRAGALPVVDIAVPGRTRTKLRVHPDELARYMAERTAKED